jgi:catechol 2,3-dioxygenase-like lactoylglutathione lyase family enzyme
VQVAYAVNDVHTAAEEWTGRFGVGPFVIREHIELESVRIEGRSGSFDHSSAYGQWGDVMLELVQQHTTQGGALHGGAPHVGATRGLHHMAFFVDDMAGVAANLTKAGIPELLHAQVAGSTTEFAFHDARETLGHLIEIYEPTERLRSFYEYVRSLSLQ